VSVQNTSADPPRGPADTVAAGSRRPGRWIGLLLAVVLVSGGVAYAVEGREQDARQHVAFASPIPIQRSPPSKTSAAVAARRLAVDAILLRRSTAVRTVNETLFLQDVDPTDAKLRQAQRVLFANLVDIGLEQIGYSQAEERFEPAMARVHGSSAYLVRVLMRYQIPKIDLTPVSTELGYTFVRRSGRWVLADDDDLDGELAPGAHREPWDLGRIEVQRGPRAMVLVEKGDTKRGRAILAAAARGLAEVTAYWPRKWGGSVLIAALDETDVRDARFAAEDRESAASTSPTFSSLPGQDTADGTVAGAYIAINPKQRDRIDEILLSHEITHVATADLGGYEPLWLAEGAAEYVSWRGIEAIAGPSEVSKWEQDVIDHSLPAFSALPSDTGFYDKNTDVYGVSWLAVGYLVRTIGLSQVEGLYEDLARNGTDQAARDRIMLARTGFTEASLFIALKAYRPQR
jgi:hypothetical protein